MGYRRFRRPLPLVARRSSFVARPSLFTILTMVGDRRLSMATDVARRSSLVAAVQDTHYAYLLYLFYLLYLLYLLDLLIYFTYPTQNSVLIPNRSA